MLNLTLVVPGLKELVVDELGGSVADAALFFTVEMVAYLLAAPLWGLASDRAGRRRPFVVAGYLGSAALYSSYLLVDSIPLLLALRFVQGALSVMGWSTVMAVIADRADGPGRARAMGAAGASLILGVGLGAPLGGWLSHALGPRAPLAASALLFAALGFAALALAEPERLGARPEIRAVLSALARTPALLLPWGFYLIERFTVGLFVILFPLYLEATTGGGPAARGRLLGLYLIPFALLQPLTYRLADRWGARRALAVGTLAYGLALAAVGWVPPAALPLWMTLLGSTAAVMFPPTLSLTAELAPPAARASAMAGFNLAGSLGFAVGPLAGTAIEAGAGFTAAFAVAGALAMAAALALALVLAARRL
jgi:MFS family permease